MTHVKHNSGKNEWYTPKEYTDAARKVMGSIDCDPASSDKANLVVGATLYYTAEDDGLAKPWFGNIWLNPPYSQPLVRQFCDAVVENDLVGDIRQACVLVNNATETKHGQNLLDNCSAVCFPRGRIKFLDETLTPAGAPLQGQMICYFGDEARKFCNIFKQFGVVTDCRD